MGIGAQSDGWAGLTYTHDAVPTEIPPRVKQNTSCRNDDALSYGQLLI
ncbi:MAG: hypothetical protein WAN17_10520 [Candidatus Sulfotelmatobacter sp.]